MGLSAALAGKSLGGETVPTQIIMSPLDLGLPADAISEFRQDRQMSRITSALDVDMEEIDDRLEELDDTLQSME